jgi:hypothetical protein
VIDQEDKNKIGKINRVSRMKTIERPSAPSVKERLYSEIKLRAIKN